MGKSIKSHKKGSIIVGDFNAWSTQWGCRKTDRRGYAVWMGETNLNDGQHPTFRRGLSESVLDLAFCTNEIKDTMVKWRVVNEKETLSDHLPIELIIEDTYKENDTVIIG